MISWFLRLIGIPGDFVDHLEDVRLGLQRPALLWLGLALLVPIGYWIHRRQRRNLGNMSAGLIGALSGIRISILTILVLVLSGPYLKIDRRNEKKPIVALLVDQSQSMDLRAGEYKDDKELERIARASGHADAEGSVRPEAGQEIARTSRSKLVHEVVAKATVPFLEPLARKYDLRCYSFAKELSRLALDPAQPELPQAAEAGGPATHLGDAIAGVLHEAAGQTVAGIVLFSDGENTGGQSLSEAAHAAGERSAPIFSVPAGSSARVRDVAIADVFTAGQVSVGDTARISVTVESQGFDNRPAKVELRENGKLVDARDVVLRSTEQQQVELTFQAEKPGAHYLTVHIPPLPEEPDELRGNNTDLAFVRVSEEKLRVLYLEGLPRWDFRFLRNSMRRDHGLAGRSANEPDVVLEAEWRRSPPERAASLPQTMDELAKYHTVILGDVSPELLNSRFTAMLARAVRERGLGLIVEAGPRAMPQAFDGTLKDLLPVVLRGRSSGLEAPVYRPFRIELTPEGAIHEATRFYDHPGRNQNTWNAMPPYYWCAAIERAAPAAAVLAWNPSVEGRFGKIPLVAYQYAGQGKVMFLGTDSTWLWRRIVGDRFFYKFWGQSIRFVARREDDSKKSRLEVRPLRAQTGEQAQVELKAFWADGSPRSESRLPVQIEGPGAPQLVEVVADPVTKGRYTAPFVPAKPGEYRLRFSDGTLEPAEARMRAQDAPEELRHPNVNRPALEVLATASGGRLVELPDLDKIPVLLQGESKFNELHREATIWDNWLTLALVACLYSIDVGLRRLTGLS
jgi:hypothetical protein